MGHHAKYISANLVCTVGQLYNKATSAVQINGRKREWFRTTVEVRQGCLLSPILFPIFFPKEICHVLEKHNEIFSTGNRNITKIVVCG